MTIYGTIKKQKTAYDPCPKGWRVPETSEVLLLNDLVKNGTVTPSSDGTTKWSYSHQQGQVWEIPLQGNIEDGTLKFATYFGNLWCRQTEKSNARDISFDPNSPEVHAGSNFRKIGTSVRCIKDTYPWYP